MGNLPFLDCHDAAGMPAAEQIKCKVASLYANDLYSTEFEGINQEKVYDLLKLKCLDKFIQNKAISKCRDSFRISEADKQKLKLLKM